MEENEFVMAGVILGIGIGVFGAVVQGNIVLLFFGAVLYALAHIFMAVFLSNFARNELQAVQMAPLIALPSMALSGMLIPINSFPEWVQTIAKFVPMYYGNRVFEGIMLKGYGIADLAPEFAIIGGVALLFFVLAVMTVKDRIPSVNKIKRTINATTGKSFTTQFCYKKDLNCGTIEQQTANSYFSTV